MVNDNSEQIEPAIKIGGSPRSYGIVGMQFASRSEYIKYLHNRINGSEGGQENLNEGETEEDTYLRTKWGLSKNDWRVRLFGIPKDLGY